MSDSIVSRRGGLFLVEAPSDERAIQRELQRRNRSWFLDKEIYEGGLLYTVKAYVPDAEPEDLLPWTDDYGRPLPLTSGILDKLDSLRPEVCAPARERVAGANARREQALEADADHAYDEIGKDLPRLGKTRVWTRQVSVPERARRNEAERRRRLAQGGR